MSDFDYEIKSELVRSLVLLGAMSDLLGTVGSWGDELDAKTVLAGIKAWNETKIKELKDRLELGGADNS